MKILVIGSSSSVGNSLIPILNTFSEVITAGRKNCDISIDLSNPYADFIFPNDIDVVINIAAAFNGKTDNEVLETEIVNTIGTLKLCQAAVKAKVKHFVLISSIFACLDVDSDYYSIYALSKKQSEEVAQYICKKNSLPLTILRPSQIYGDKDSFRKHQPFIYKMVDLAEAGKDICIFGSNDALRNYIYIDDLNTIISKVIQKKIKGTFSCMHIDNLSYSQIAKAAYNTFNVGGKVVFLENIKDIPNNIFEKDDSLYKKISFYPQISIEEGIKRIANFRKKNS